MGVCVHYKYLEFFLKYSVYLLRKPTTLNHEIADPWQKRTSYFRTTYRHASLMILPLAFGLLLWKMSLSSFFPPSFYILHSLCFFFMSFFKWVFFYIFLTFCNLMQAYANLLKIASAASSSLTEPDQLIISSCASPSENLISLSHSMLVFSANLFRLFLQINANINLLFCLTPFKKIHSE